MIQTDLIIILPESHFDRLRMLALVGSVYTGKDALARGWSGSPRHCLWCGTVDWQPGRREPKCLWRNVPR